MPGRDTLYYDGECGVCTNAARRLRALDWLRRLEFVDMLRVPPDELPVPIETAMRGMPMRTRGGRVLVGFPTIRRALIQTPLGALVAWALYVPGVDALGGRVYNRIAANRARNAACESK